MKKISLSVIEFALPCPRRGSIDVNSGFGQSSELGQEIHKKVQAQRLAEFGSYQAEVAIEHSFPVAGYQFDIRGRMDGFFDQELPKIEEIKSTFNIYELIKALNEANNEHPYSLQLRTYGYFYWFKYKKKPQLILHLASTRNGDSYDYEVNLNIVAYEGWLKLRLDELVEEVHRDEKRKERRLKMAQALQFPFAQPRAGQVELIQTIEEGMTENRPMLLQAPTGLGKTVGVLYPTLKEALKRGQKVIYITPKNSQHTVAEEAVEKMQERGAKNLKSLTITAKSKMCFKNEPICNPDYCEYAKDHFTKMAEHQVLEKLSKKRKLTAKGFKKIAEEYQVCPFEIQLDAALDADTVICDYNYVFAPTSAFGRISKNGLVQEGKPNLVIDEAHNLPSRAMDYYSPSLSVLALEKMREEATYLPTQYRKEALPLIDDCISVLKQCAQPGVEKAHEILPPMERFLEQDESLRRFLSSYLSSDVEIQPRDVVMRLSFYWSEFVSALSLVEAERKAGGHKFFTTFSPFPPTVRITCSDASEMLKNHFEDFQQVVAFSATLKPFEYYSQLSGLHSPNLKKAEFLSPFQKRNRKILLIPQISSKFSERDKNYPRIAEAIQKISSLKRGNYIAFFPSFEFMDRVWARFHAASNVHVLKQERSMKKDEIDHVLSLLKDTSAAHILFAVQGGVFSEGVDYPGSMVIGAFVVGPPLPNFNLEREKMREYYEEHYSAGYDYAYTYPAMAKAIQAAGRVIRSETDQGIIVLMDSRFMQDSYAKSMPQDWFDQSPQEMVSKSILKDISNFWDGLKSEPT